jgi:hypothetical protein
MLKLSLLLVYMTALVAMFKRVIEIYTELVKKQKPLATVSWNG